MQRKGVTPGQWKRLKVSEALLKNAHGALPRPGLDAEARFKELEKEFIDYLDHNEHELAMNMLEELGELVQPRGGFWKDLIRAAENMEMSERVSFLEKKFSEAIDRLKPDEKTADRVVKSGSFLYDDPVRCRVEIVQTNFRPGIEDDEGPVEDAHGEFYEVRYSWPNSENNAGGGYHDSLAEAVRAVESKVRDVQWED